MLYIKSSVQIIAQSEFHERTDFFTELIGVKNISVREQTSWPNVAADLKNVFYEREINPSALRNHILEIYFAE